MSPFRGIPIISPAELLRSTQQTKVKMMFGVREKCCNRGGLCGSTWRRLELQGSPLRIKGFGGASGPRPARAMPTIAPALYSGLTLRTSHESCLRFERRVTATPARLRSDLPATALVGRDLHPQVNCAAGMAMLGEDTNVVYRNLHPQVNCAAAVTATTILPTLHLLE